MAAEWFLKVGNQVHGPMSAAELRQKAAAGLIGSETPIRKGADGRWVPAAKVQGLFQSPPATAASRVEVKAVSRTGAPSAEKGLQSPASPPPLPPSIQPASSDSPRRMNRWLVSGILATGGVVVVALLAWVFLLRDGDKKVAPSVWKPPVDAELVVEPRNGNKKQAPSVSQPLKTASVAEQYRQTAQQPNRKDDKSPEEIYADASPSVVSLKVYNDKGRATFSGSGFILADRPAKSVQVDVNAKRFAADLADCAKAHELVEESEDEVAPSKLSSSSRYDKYSEFLKTQRKATERLLPTLQQVFIATNYHVIESAVSIRVRLHDGSIGFVSETIQEDESADVAVLLAWLPDGKRPPGIALSSALPNVGAKIFVIGSPLGLESSLSEGLISGIRELEPDRSHLQITAAISHGSSGGPVIATNGRVVGIATFSFRRGQNLNFAVPASEVSRLLERPPKAARGLARQERFAGRGVRA